VCGMYTAPAAGWTQMYRRRHHHIVCHTMHADHTDKLYTEWAPRGDERERQTDRQFMLEVLIQTYKHTAPMQMVDVACCQCIHHAHPHTHTHTYTHTHTLHTASCIQRQVENIGHMRWVLCGGNQRRDG
jgi:hypothetical protein